ncbi:MAG: hypothetical protein SNJ58_09725 [Aggregatilineales bacterium]
MTPIERLQIVAPLLVAILLGLGALLFALSMLMFRRSRRNAFWRQRRAAGQAGFRFFVWSLIMSVAGAMLWTTTALATWVAFPNGMPTSAAILPSPTTMPTLLATETPSPTETLGPTLAIPIVETAPFASVTQTPDPTQTSLALPFTATSTMSLTPSHTATPTFTSTATATPTAAHTPTPTLTPTLIPSATPTAVPTETPTPTSTFTPSATITPSPTLIALSLLSAPTLETSVTPSLQARLSIAAIGTRLNSSGQIGDAQELFRAPITRVYFAVRAASLQSGVLWRRELWHNGALMQAASHLWGMRGDGQAVFFFGQAEGFPTGDYEIRLYIGMNETAAARATFRIQ